MRERTQRSPNQLRGGSVGSTKVENVARREGERVRRFGVLMNLAAEDPVSIARAEAFAQGLQVLGWIEGRNVHVDFRWAAAKAELFHRYAE
jgi:putative tryptophan/tyrosine transport system substrate-binding protein